MILSEVAPGDRLAGRIKPMMLRWIVISIGLLVAVIHFIR